MVCVLTQVVGMVLSSIAATDKTNLMLASHNQHSVELAIQTMNQLQMDAAVNTNHPTIHPQMSAELINASAPSVSPCGPQLLQLEVSNWLVRCGAVVSDRIRSHRRAIASISASCSACPIISHLHLGKQATRPTSNAPRSLPNTAHLLPLEFHKQL